MSERTHEDDRPRGDEAQGRDEPSSAPKVVIRGGHEQVAAAERRDAVIAWSLAAAAFVAAVVLDVRTHPVAWTFAISTGLSLVIDRLAVAPLVRFGLRLGAARARLRAALACPYCKDALPADAAIACDRKGCGAFYHDECWAEVRASYGGCAVYGCGSTAGHPVGRFGLQRHVLRLLLAAALFTPKLVKRIQEGERQRFADVWRQAREYQAGISRDASRTIALGIVNLVVSVAGTLATVVTLELLGVEVDRLPRAGKVALVLLACVVPIVIIRMPLAGHFGWGASRLLGRVFRDELAALRRADEGTFLARLAGGAGKKDA